LVNVTATIHVNEEPNVFLGRRFTHGVVLLQKTFKCNWVLFTMFERFELLSTEIGLKLFPKLRGEVELRGAQHTIYPIRLGLIT